MEKPSQSDTTSLKDQQNKVESSEVAAPSSNEPIEKTETVTKSQESEEDLKTTSDSALSDSDSKKLESTVPSVESSESKLNGSQQINCTEKNKSDSDQKKFDSSSEESSNSGLQAILANLTEVIQQQLTPLLESCSLPGINITAAMSANGNINLNSLQQQLAVAQVATATQLQRSGGNPNQQRYLNTASLLASQLSAAACAAAAVANSEDPSSKLSSNSTNSISPSSSPSLTCSSGNSNWNQQQLNNQNSWQQHQSQKQLNGTSAQAAAAAWTSALHNASSQNNLNQYHNPRGGMNQQKVSNGNMLNQQQPKGNNMNNILTVGNASANSTTSTMQQALNSLYSGNVSQQQMKSSNGNLSTTNNMNNSSSNGAISRNGNHNSNNYYMENAGQNQNKNFEGLEDQDKGNSGNTGAFDLSMINSQLIELIRQDPSQLEQILKLKMFQGGEDVTNLIEELQQLDQTVPANLAAAAAALSAANNQSNNLTQQNTNRNSPRSGNQNQNYSSNYNLMQQQNLQMAQQHQLSMHGHTHKQFPQNFQQNNFPHNSNNQFQSQQQQQFHPNFLQLTLQQQQQLSQFQDYHEERFSRKVFVGGLPPDIDEDEIVTHFRRYGNLIVDWPHKAESKSYFPPKGYAFLIFQEERSVQDLIETCVMDDGKLYMVVSSPSMKDKPVQIRPWCLNDSDFVMDGSQPLDPRKTIFVGGVPRPLKAIELAMIMDRFYGGVCYAGIDTDPELKYPKGAGRVAFSNQQSYIAAISARFVQLQHGEIDKRVEVKPYVLDDQMCDECQGARCGGKFAPFFCANVTCLQYYCEACWATIHTRQGREYHKPLVKEGADRPRPIPYK